MNHVLCPEGIAADVYSSHVQQHALEFLRLELVGEGGGHPKYTVFHSLGSSPEQGLPRGEKKQYTTRPVNPPCKAQPGPN